MYTEYNVENATIHHIDTGGSESASWTRLWDSLKPSSEKQLQSFAATTQWREISKFCQPGWSVLEAGCGLGGWVRFLKNQGLQPTGLDYSEETVARLKTEFPELTWTSGDIRDIPLKNDSFEMLVSWGVIEHQLEGPAKSLEEFLRVLKPGGIAFITVPWLSPWRQRHGLRSGGDNRSKLKGEPAFHQYYFDTQELTEYVTDAGFQIIKTCPSAIHAKSLLPKWVCYRLPLFTKIFNKLLSPVLPSSMTAHMILVIAQKAEG